MDKQKNIKSLHGSDQISDYGYYYILCTTYVGRQIGSWDNTSNDGLKTAKHGHN